mmetsp:Transcript_22560/g.89597  ORF Transcript_22560/g.89597 Transcript_22560/m.89597 type:complete len:290 (-) Transcript_22560:709-1578(-)
MTKKSSMHTAPNGRMPPNGTTNNGCAYHGGDGTARTSRFVRVGGAPKHGGGPPASCLCCCFDATRAAPHAASGPAMRTKPTAENETVANVETDRLTAAVEDSRVPATNDASVAAPPCARTTIESPPSVRATAAGYASTVAAVRDASRLVFRRCGASVEEVVVVVWGSEKKVATAAATKPLSGSITTKVATTARPSDPRFAGLNTPTNAAPRTAKLVANNCVPEPTKSARSGAYEGARKTSPCTSFQPDSSSSSGAALYAEMSFLRVLKRIIATTPVRKRTIMSELTMEK